MYTDHFHRLRASSPFQVASEASRGGRDVNA